MTVRDRHLYRVLVVENVQNIAEMICRTAAEMDFETCMANGSNATSMYNTFSPDIVVLDLLMPQMDGFEFLQFLVKVRSLARIIIFSGSSDTYRKAAEKFALSKGLIIEGNVSKPFRINEVRALFEKTKASLQEATEMKKQSNA